LSEIIHSLGFDDMTVMRNRHSCVRILCYEKKGRGICGEIFLFSSLIERRFNNSHALTPIQKYRERGGGLMNKV
jgi:hypothetical protein